VGGQAPPEKIVGGLGPCGPPVPPPMTTLTLNGFPETQNMVLTLGNAQIWLGTSPVVLKFILVFFHFVVCNCLFTKSIRSHSDIGRMTERF